MPPGGPGGTLIRMRSPWVRAAAAAVALVLLGSGCGSSGTSTTTQLSASSWANGVCNAVHSYADQLKRAADTFKENPTSAGLRRALNQVQSATRTFKANVKGFGRPETAASKQAKQAIDSLASELSQATDTARAAAASAQGVTGLLNAVSVIGDTFVSARQQISATVTELGKLGRGELKDAFASSDSCKSLASG